MVEWNRTILLDRFAVLKILVKPFLDDWAEVFPEQPKFVRRLVCLLAEFR